MGLATGYLLAKRGHTVTVYEADDRIGGMSAHFDFDGLRLERYYHFLCKTDTPLFDLLEELDLSHTIRWNTTRMGLYYKGEMHEWGRPDALLKFPHLTKREKARYAAHVLRARHMVRFRSLDMVEATAWIRKWIGNRAYEMLWAKSFELKFYEHTHSISAAWIATRIKRVSMSRRDPFNEELAYLEGGSERLLDALRTTIESTGGSVRVNSPVTRVLSHDGQVTGVQVNDEECLHDIVVSTAPLQFVPRLAPQLPEPEQNRIRKIQNIGVRCAVFKLSERYTPYFWVNINDPRVPVPGVIEYTNLNPLASHVVYLPYYLPVHHPRWEWSDERLLDEARQVLQDLRPGWDPSTIEAAHVSRYRYAQPICHPGFEHDLPPMRTSIRGFVIADTSYAYPEDRSISESIRVAHRLVEACE